MFPPFAGPAPLTRALPETAGLLYISVISGIAFELWFTPENVTPQPAER